MKTNKKAILFAILTLLWTGVIFAFSLQPANQSANLSGGILTRILAWIHQWTGVSIPLEMVHNLFRKLAHFAEFFLLGLFSGCFLKSVNRNVFYAMFYGSAIAVLDECLQLITGEGRAMRISDMALDASGVLVALLILWVIIRKNTDK